MPTYRTLIIFFNDLTECQRYNRQIVSFQTQNRNTDEDTKYRRYRRTDKERQNEAYLVACDQIFHGMIKKMHLKTHPHT